MASRSSSVHFWKWSLATPSMLLSLVIACDKNAPSPSATEASKPSIVSTDQQEASPAPHGDSTGDHSTHHKEHTGRSHHFENPEAYLAAWNDPERDDWQKPLEIVAALRLEPGATVVDLGAGTGYLIPNLSQAVGQAGMVIAADIEPAMLRFLDETAKEEGWDNVRTHPSTPSALDLPPASADGIVTLNTWHHIEDREAYAKGVFDVVRPGAIFLVIDFLAERTEGFGPPLSMRLTAEQVVAELEAGGFEVDILPETMPRHYMVRGVRQGRAR